MPLPDNTASIYIAKPEFISELCSELQGKTHVEQDMVFSSQPDTQACFALDVWQEPQIVSFQSISEAVKILRQAGKYWYLHPLNQVRRSRLIEEQLRRPPSLMTHFTRDIQVPDIGGFCLLDQNTLIYSTHRQKKWPDGKSFFIEDKVNPPNRAYLKLWEALFLLDKYPGAGDSALDLGASPGGWTYVMQSLGARVTAVDKAPLNPDIASLPGVTSLQQSAFSIEPDKLDEAYDWVLSDVACYPDRAYALILKWIKSAKARHMIFTIKLQGKTDLETIRQFQSIPDSRIVNMFYNKHEATFFYTS
ncbi:SAM-dependent methyltransferase [Legionella sp. CNM-4043-24]|uniref:SAM-dependent methyltransferase n=1 Tax=Legionella sp. CNM-4043-24 TaxID=3421646 RepID=UPI00403AEDC8